MPARLRERAGGRHGVDGVDGVDGGIDDALTGQAPALPAEAAVSLFAP